MTESIKLSKVQSLKVSNVMEAIVDDNFGAILPKFPDICKCDQCLADIKAVALNKLTPHYVASDKGSVYERANLTGMLYKIDVLRALTEAAEIVSKNPHHSQG